MRNILFFDPSVSGHILEYLYDYFSNVTDLEHNHYTLIVNSEFTERCKVNKMHFDKRINIVFLSDEEVVYCSKGNMLQKAWKHSLLLRRYVLRYNIDKVFLNYLMPYLPFICFVLPKKVKVCGIVYKIFLYEDKIKRRDLWLYKLLSFSSKIQSVFLLNDKNSPSFLNSKYGVNKFQYLTDPIPNIDFSKVKNVREKYDIPENHKVFLQYGIQKRKSSLEILAAIDSLTFKEVKNKTFIFAGVNGDSTFSESFKSKVKSNKNKDHLIVKLGYLPFEDMCDLIYSSDVLFCLYKNSSQSSGFIGHSAFFEKFVIGSSKGLLGKLISENKLGCCVDNGDSSAIKRAILQEHILEKNDYVKTHTPLGFAQAIESCLTAYRSV